MKKQLLLLGTTFCSFIAMSQVANGDFENWTSSFVYHVPTPWASSNMESGGAVANTNPSTDAQHLTKSVRMETILEGTDSSFGYVLLGDMGDNGPENGFPYTGVTGVPDSLIFWTKYNVQSTDSATALFAMTYLGTPSGMDVFKWIGTQNTWERKAFKINATVVDSVIIAFASSNALNDYGVPGSWLMIDDVQVKTSTGAIFLPPNNSFETWDSAYIEEADDWYSSNLFYSEDTTVLKTTDAYSNTYAAEIRTVLGDYNDTLQGYLSNGPSINGGWFTGVPYTAVPASMDLYYKYLPSGVDSAWIQIDLMEGTNSIGGGSYQIKNMASAYTALSIPVSQYGVGTVDSMRIIFNSGRNPGTILFVDNVSLNGGTVSTDEISIENTIKHYPNPVVDELTISFNSVQASKGTIEIMDINGKLIMSKNLTVTSGANKELINTQGLAKGMYTYTLSFNEERVTNKFIKK